MASSLQLHLWLLLFLSYFLFLGHAYWVLPVGKDPATLQYLTHTRIGGSPEPIGLVVDLGGRSLWVDCSPSFSSRPIGSCSIECLKAYGSCSHSSVCDLSLENSITGSTATGEVAEASLAVGSALISCAPKHLLRGLAIGARGMLGLGRSRIALPSQLGRRFALCLSSSDGLLISGHGHHLLPITNSLTYTPLVQVPQQQQGGYFVKVNHIKINGKRLSLVPLTAEISTTEPYSKMESSVFATFVEALAIACSNMRRVAAVEPFEVCYAAVVVPEIDLVLQSEMVKWRVEGMVRVSEEVMCLGLVDGGADMQVPMVVGGHQLEDVWLQFDLASSMLGFTSSLLTRKTSCSSLTSQIQHLLSNQSL